MPKHSFADVELSVEPGDKPLARTLDPDAPFRVLLLGDFSGRANRGIFEPGAIRRPVPVDRDNFDEVLAAMSPELRIPVAGVANAATTVCIRELDDFHPGRLFESLDLFRALRDARNALSEPATFAAAAAALAPAPPQPAAPPVPAVRLSLDDLLESGADPAASPGRAPDDWERLVHEIVAPHLVARADPRQAEMVAQVDSSIADQMRALLHHAAFQELEAAWRALYFLICRLETDSALKLYILDISKEELGAELQQAKDDLRASAAWRILVRDACGTPGAEPWTVIAGNYAFDQSTEDLELLARMGAIAEEAGAPFLAGVRPQMLENLAAGPFQRLRALPQARRIGLALPRWLLRLPYGQETAPVDQFRFEEMPAHEHEAYLWANAAFACTYLLARAFKNAGWSLSAGFEPDVNDLPLHVYDDGRATKIKPCAEVLMTEQSAMALLENGLMPLASIKDHDAVRLVRCQSIADPPAPLAGRWS